MSLRIKPLSRALVPTIRSVGEARSLSITSRSLAAAASAAASTARSSSDSISAPVSAPRTYARRVAAPVSSAPAAASPTSTRSARTPSLLRTAARSVPTNPIPATASAPTSLPGSDEAEYDYSLPDVSTGIDDYAHLQPPSSASRSSRSSPAPASVSSTRSAGSAETPTPSPPLTRFVSGPSDLPIIARTPDIPGEAAVPADAADWSTSFAGLGERAFPKEVAEALLKPLEPADVEVKPDGLLYLPEIKYRRTLNAAFGPGGWGLAPRGETNVGPRIVSREWGLIAMGRLVSVARGEQEYFDPSGVPTATEACKSNALMRCCKDLGIASELWDPRYIREFKAKYCTEVFVEHVTSKKKRKLWRKKDGKFDYPYKEG